MTVQDMHLHTTFSDGTNTPVEMAEMAYRCGCTAICFTDHVRHNSKWWPEYLKCCRNLQRHWRGRMDIFCGVEAKVCDFHGTLDIPPDLDPDILQVAALHRLPIGDGNFWSKTQLYDNGEKAVSFWISAMEGLQKNRKIARIAHPFSLLPHLKLIQDDGFWNRILAIFSAGTYQVEYNTKYDNSFVPQLVWDILGDRVVHGSDSHSCQDLYSAHSILLNVD